MWLSLYRFITWLLLGCFRLALPLVRARDPKLAKWFLLRYKPEPLSFQPRIWIHAVSVGELNIALALLGGIDKVANDTLITTATHSGHNYLTEKLDRERVRYLPWDLSGCYRAFFKGHRVPDLIVVETEIWPNLFAFVRNSGAKLAIVNGRLSEKTLRVRRVPLFRAALRRVNCLAARTRTDAERFIAMGVPETVITVTGNIKYDFAPKTLDQGPLKTWLETNRPVLFASISEDEAMLLAPAVKALHESGRSVLWAPRHLNTLETHQAALSDLNPTRRSQIEQNTASRLVILDTFGELSGCYAHAVISLVGGSFNDRGGQNFLESLQAGTPAMVGPYTPNFRREVEDALAAGALIVLDRPDQVVTAMTRLLDHPEQREAIAERARAFIAKGRGAIERTRAHLLDSGIVDGTTDND